MNKLIEKARERHIRKNKFSDISDDEIGLGIAWANDEVTPTQVCYALGRLKKGERMTGGNILYYLASVLREGFRRGIISATTKEDK